MKGRPGGIGKINIQKNVIKKCELFGYLDIKHYLCNAIDA